MLSEVKRDTGNTGMVRAPFTQVSLKHEVQNGTDNTGTLKFFLFFTHLRLQNNFRAPHCQAAAVTAAQCHLCKKGLEHLSVTCSILNLTS